MSALIHPLPRALSMHQRQKTPRSSHVLTWGFFILSLWLLRAQLLTEMDLSLQEGLQIGLGWGLYLDLSLLLIVGAGAACLGLLAIPKIWGKTLLMMATWFVTFANLIHYRFFHAPLDWWVVKAHLGDVEAAGASTGSLASTPLIFGAALCLGVSLLALHLLPRGAPVSRPRWRTGLIAGLLILSTLLVWRIPSWVRNNYDASPVLSNHILRAWTLQIRRKGMFSGAGIGWANQLDPKDTVPSRALARYRDFEVQNAPTTSNSSQWPLWRHFSPAPETTEALRRRLGLPLEGPIHTVVLLLESVRAYEFSHPDIGRELFGELWQLIDDHGIFFEQAYSSSFAAGATVRGTFSTMCSMLPNALGAATFMAHPSLRARCLQDLYKDAGYQTLWFNSHNKEFHGKLNFSLQHGTQTFYDHTEFKARGVTETLGKWGLADGPVLQASAELLEEHASGDTPLFAELLTISTHHPYWPIEGQTLPKAVAAIEGSESYRGYLSRLYYSGQSVAAFARRLLNGPMGERTLLVVLGDHSVGVPSSFSMTAVQQHEMRARIPLMLLSKNLGAGERISTPVHQVDIAPTLARIAGLSGWTHWVGRGLFTQPHGSPWVFGTATSPSVSYRHGQHACYGEDSQEIHCWDVTGKDPLYEGALLPATETPETTAFFRNVLHSNLQAIARNLVAPPKAQATITPGASKH